MDEHQKTKYIIDTVRNATKVLKLFTKDIPEWSLTDISRSLNLNISNVKRIVKTLETYDYLQRDVKTKKYYLGYMIIQLSDIITSTMEIHREAKPVMEDLVEKVNEAIHLGVLEGTNTVYLNLLESKKPIRLNSYIGKHNPSYCTGCGKVLLAYQKTSRLNTILDKLESEGFIRYGRNTVTNSNDLVTQLKEIRRKKHAVCIDEFYEGFSIGAPIYDYTGNVIAAISITGRINPTTNENIPYYTKEIIKAGKIISEKLGYFHYN